MPTGLNESLNNFFGGAKTFRVHLSFFRNRPWPLQPNILRFKRKFCKRTCPSVHPSQLRHEGGALWGRLFYLCKNRPIFKIPNRLWLWNCVTMTSVFKSREKSLFYRVLEAEAEAQKHKQRKRNKNWPLLNQCFVVLFQETINWRCPLMIWFEKKRNLMSYCWRTSLSIG